MNLLSINNTKFDKSVKFNSQYQIFGLSLAPAKESGYQVCPNSTTGCRASCIYSSGYANIFPTVKESRLRKTKMWFEDKQTFINQLMGDLYLAEQWGESNKVKVAVRLNVFSDIPWERTLPDVFESFPNISFYDYTKNFSRMVRFVKGKFPKNYHLTFSRSENNDKKCDKILGENGNVAIVFEKELPSKWGDYIVVDGDKHDLRFLDKSPRVIGLKAKAYGKKDNTGFVIREQD